MKEKINSLATNTNGMQLSAQSKGRNLSVTDNFKRFIDH